MKKIFLVFIALCMLSCNSSSNKSSSSQEEQPLVTYIYDGNKEICLYSNDIATVNGQSGVWYMREKTYSGVTADLCDVYEKTYDYIWVSYGQNSLIIWPHTGLVFIGIDNANASFDDPSNERIGKRCHKKR